jgi:hypothetical protein
MFPSAHARWFVDDPHGFSAQWDFLVEPRTLVLLAGGVLTVAVMTALLRRSPAPTLPGTARLGSVKPLLPRLLAAAQGLSLLLMSVEEHFVVPTLALDAVPAGAGAAIAQAIVGLWLLTGVALRPAAGALALLLVAAGLAGGPVLWLEGAYVGGVALYVALTARVSEGRRSASDAHAARTLAVLLGAALVVVAFTEKLANPALALAVLEDHPVLNLPSMVGLGLVDEEFVRLAGVVELTLGLLIAMGTARQIVALVAIGPFVATVAVFGVPELAGHLPIYAGLLALAVHGTSAAQAQPALALATPSPRAGDPHPRPVPVAGTVGAAPTGDRS